jgi:fumarate reductase flavoprotein subunit
LPFVLELARIYIGVDPVKEMIPIRPFVHYMMGGVDTDIDAATELPGLYAAGEVACISLNGANRLGSNSLSECLVFGAVAGRKSLEFARGSSAGNEDALRTQTEEEAARIDNLRGSQRGSERIAQIRREMNASMEEGCGVYREQASMQTTVDTLMQLKSRVGNLHLEDSSKVFNTELVAALEIVNMVDIAESVANSALTRKESRGAHTCSDYTTRDDQNYLYHTLCYHAGDGRPRMGRKDVKLGHWELEERKY